MCTIGLTALLAACSSPAHRASTPTPTSSTTTTTSPEVRTPVLGRVWGPGGQKGYGSARPALIFNGGDPTGLVEDVRWQSWGGVRAIGSGYSYYPHASVADSTREPVTVVAFDLSQCRGIPAYTAIEWYFPEHGERFDPNNYINVCTGDYVGSP